VTLLAQASDQRPADRPGGAGDQDSHCDTPLAREIARSTLLFVIGMIPRFASPAAAAGRATRRRTTRADRKVGAVVNLADPQVD
jgi:hypothetical protein